MKDMKIMKIHDEMVNNILRFSFYIPFKELLAAFMSDTKETDEFARRHNEAPSLA